MRRMLDQTMAWIIGVTASTAATGGLVYGISKMHISEDSEGSHDPKVDEHHSAPGHVTGGHEPAEHGEASEHNPPTAHGKPSEHEAATPAGHGKGSGESNQPGEGKEADHGESRDNAHPAAGEHPAEHGQKKDDHASPEEHGAASHAPTAVAAHNEVSNNKDWRYTGDRGPENWGSLSTEFAACGTGKNQSPVNFQTVTPSDRDMPVDFHYRESILQWKFSGNSLQADVGTGSYITFEKKRYQLLNFNFHTPSEHTIHGEAYPAEIQLVHKSSAGKVTIVSLLVKDGDSNDAMQELVEKMPRQENKAVKIGPFSPDRVLPNQGYYYSYLGSLTVPPCNEDVRWIVMKQPIEMSSRQLASLSNMMGNNARPTQELSGRKPRLEGVEHTAH